MDKDNSNLQPALPTKNSLSGKPSLRVLFLLTQDLDSPSGLGRYLPMARELSRLGYRVSVAALHSGYQQLLNRRYTEKGVDIHYVAPMHVLKQGSLKTYYSSAGLVRVAAQATWQLSRAALGVDADIIHIGKPHPMNSLAGMAAKTLRRRRVLLDCDDYEAGVGHFRTTWEKRGVVYFENRMPLHVDQVTTNTYFTLNRLIGLGVQPERITYISNGVDRQRFLPPDPEQVIALRSSLGLNGKRVVAFIGSLSRPGHPVDLLFSAFQHVQEQIPESALLVVGGGDDFPRLEARAKEMGLADRVRFTGRIAPEEIAAYYHLAHALVDPVLDDGAARGRSPLKLFESWACGVPFVSCDAGDRRLLLGEPPAGLLARPGDSSSLAEQILKALTDPYLAERLRQHGAERVQAYYWDFLVKDLDQLYRRTLKNNR